MSSVLFLNSPVLLADTQFHGPVVFVLLDGGIGPDAHVQVTILCRLPEKLHVPTVQQVVAPGNKYFLWHNNSFYLLLFHFCVIVVNLRMINRFLYISFSLCNLSQPRMRVNTIGTNCYSSSSFNS